MVACRPNQLARIVVFGETGRNGSAMRKSLHVESRKCLEGECRPSQIKSACANDCANGIVSRLVGANDAGEGRILGSSAVWTARGAVPTGFDIKLKRLGSSWRHFRRKCSLVEERKCIRLRREKVLLRCDKSVKEQRFPACRIRSAAAAAEQDSAVADWLRQEEWFSAVGSVRRSYAAAQRLDARRERAPGDTPRIP